MLKKIWKDPVWSVVISAGILALIASVSAYFSGAWPSMKSMLTHVWLFITSNTVVPNWLIGIMLVPCLIFGYVLLVGLKEWVISSGSEESFKSYKKDELFGLIWVWQYSSGRIDNVHSLCPRCQYQIIPKCVSYYDAAPRYDYTCDDCGYSIGTIEGYPEDLIHKVKLKIQKALRTGEWRNRQSV